MNVQLKSSQIWSSIRGGTRKVWILVVLSLVCLVLLSPAELFRQPANAAANKIETLAVQADEAAVNRMLSYQGRLLDPVTGAPKVDGNYSVGFRLYTVANGGSAIWSENKTVSVSGGLFSTNLGDTASLDLDDFNGDDLYLGISVGSDPEAVPRLRLAYSAYAIYAVKADSAASAADANTLDGKDSTEFANAGHAHSGGDITSGTVADTRIAGTITRDDEVMTIVEDNDGAGTGLDADLLDGQDSASFATSGHDHDTAYVNSTGPDKITGESTDAILSVVQTGSGMGGHFSTASSYAVQAESDSGFAAYMTSPGGGLYAESSGPASDTLFGNNTATTGASWGVRGSSASPDGRGVTGFNFAGTGSAYGVYGQSSSASGIGVYGNATASSGTNNGVYGVTSSSSGRGVYGESPYIGVWGEGRYGVYGHASADNGYGVFGSSAGTTGSYAGYFNGPVHVTGALSKSSGSFKIDHPLDPANMYLSHSFVESPDMMNVYNGNVVLDENGTAWVQMPEWFQTLNRDFRYQLSAIGGPGPNLHIAQPVSDNRFQIGGGSPGLQVSWQVTGIRQDPYAEANRIQVEEMKPDAARGTYLHPELYGADQDSRTGRSQQIDPGNSAVPVPPAATGEKPLPEGR